MPHNNSNDLSPRPDVLTRPKLEGGRRFVLQTPFKPAGDQPAAIDQLVEGIHDGLSFQTLLGVTGSGKTFTGLLFARVLAGAEGRIAVIDTERGSASKYAGDVGGDFDALDLGVATLPPDRLGPVLLEPHASWMTRVAADWAARYGVAQ